MEGYEIEVNNEIKYVDNNKMNRSEHVQKFKHNFEQFIKKYQCQHHQKALNLFCIDSGCQNRGLICSLCLTINNQHRNHDAVQIVEYVEDCLTSLSKEKTKDEVLDLLNRIHVLYDNLKKILTSFVENCNQIVKNYTTEKSNLHEKRVKDISSYTPTKKIIQCKFKSLSQANKMLSSLSNKFVSLQLEKTINLDDRTVSGANNYVDDLTYEVSLIGKQFKKIQTRIKELLIIKQSSPSVLSYEPTFFQPTLLKNNDLTYIGQSKDNKPHGKGIAFYNSTQKIVYGQFLNGKLDGFSQLYYLTGDYYLGQFINDKKDGRGIYRWNGKQYNLYQGQFKSGRRNGRGTFWWEDGSKYCGQFLQGQQTGFGVLYRAGNNICQNNEKVQQTLMKIIKDLYHLMLLEQSVLKVLENGVFLLQILSNQINLYGINSWFIFSVLFLYRLPQFLNFL